jgi:hypothetical protein
MDPLNLTRLPIASASAAAPADDGRGGALDDFLTRAALRSCSAGPSPLAIELAESRDVDDRQDQLGAASALCRGRANRDALRGFAFGALGALGVLAVAVLVQRAATRRAVA